MRTRHLCCRDLGKRRMWAKTVGLAPQKRWDNFWLALREVRKEEGRHSSHGQWPKGRNGDILVLSSFPVREWDLMLGKMMALDYIRLWMWRRGQNLIVTWSSLGKQSRVLLIKRSFVYGSLFSWFSHHIASGMEKLVELGAWIVR